MSTATVTDPIVRVNFIQFQSSSGFTQYPRHYSLTIIPTAPSTYTEDRINKIVYQNEYNIYHQLGRSDSLKFLTSFSGNGQQSIGVTMTSHPLSITTIQQEYQRFFSVNQTQYRSFTNPDTNQEDTDFIRTTGYVERAATNSIFSVTSLNASFAASGVSLSWNLNPATSVLQQEVSSDITTISRGQISLPTSYTFNILKSQSSGNENVFAQTFSVDTFWSTVTITPVSRFFSVTNLGAGTFLSRLNALNFTNQVVYELSTSNTVNINSVQINSLNTSSLVASWAAGVPNSQTVVLFQGSTSIHTFRSVTSGDTLSVDTLVTPGYSYAVQVSNAAFTSTQSAATSLVCRRPELVNMDSWFSNTSFRYTFTPSLGATSYPLILYTGTTSNLTTNSTVVGTYTGVPFPNTTTNFITPTTLTTGNFYAFRVGAGNSAGIAYSTLSYPIRYSPPLTSITNVSISKLTDAEIRVSWSGGNNSVNNVVTLFSSVDRVTNEIVKNYYSVTSGVTDLSIQTGPGVYYTAQVYAEDLIGNKVLSTLSSYTQHRSTKPEIPVITRITEKDITVQSVNTFQNIPQRIILHERETPFGSFVANKNETVSNVTSFPLTIPFTNAVGSLNVGPIPGKYYSAVAQTLVGTGNTSFVSEQTTPATLFISPPTSMTTYSIATLTANSVVFTYVGGLSAQSVTVNLHASSDGQANTISTRTTFNTSAVSHLPSYRNTLTFNTALSKGFYAVSFIAYNNFGSLSTSVSNFQALL
jgi:hypothetical protein